MWARGIQISRVDVNQAVAIPMSIDGQETSAAQRYSRVLPNRDAWIFAEVDVEDGWEARDITAKLTIHRADDTTLEALQTVNITRDTSEWQQDTTPIEGGRNKLIAVNKFEGFYFGIPAEEVVPYIKYRVELFEVDDALAGTPEPSPLPSIPAAEEDPAWIGVEDDSYTNIRITMVPIQYDYSGCQAIPPTDDEYIQGYMDDLYGSNPVENVEWYVHDPFPWDETLESGDGLANLLGAMSELKESEDADENMYYYALIDNCGKCIVNFPGCIVGMARLPGDTKSTMDSLQRVGSGLISPGPGTFTHEIGHAQGRRHIECEGAGAAGTDPDYPYNNGILGSWGFDILGFVLHNAELGYDYMSYCGPSWVSNWQYNATFDRISTLSSWEMEAPEPDQPVAAGASPGMLMGNLNRDGSGYFFTTDRHLSGQAPRSAAHRVEFWQDGTLLADEAAHVVQTAHGDSLAIGVPLPADFDVDSTQILFRGDQLTAPIELEPSRLHH